MGFLTTEQGLRKLGSGSSTIAGRGRADGEGDRRRAEAAIRAAGLDPVSEVKGRVLVTQSEAIRPKVG
jgi:hypothetical protein